MIDFTHAKEEFNNYRGSEKKKTLIYNDTKYLVKFPDPIREKNKNVSYINNAFSEYVGSNIFKICGFQVQDVVLGTYNYKGKEKIVCACKDFTNPNTTLFEFENLALSSNPDKKIETEITDIMDVIDENEAIIHASDIKNKFWDMFIIDSLIGNTDRHNGNWGFILIKDIGMTTFAPIYDCGSCLNPMLDDVELEKLDDNEIKNLAINCYSCLKEKGKKINYMTYISSMENKECNAALIRTFNKINIDGIEKFIDGVACMSRIRTHFYKKMIRIRYDILKDIYSKLNEISY